MNKMTMVTLVLAGFAAMPAMAQQTAALVEDVSAGVAGIEALDYVAAGQTITLGPGKSVVLSYLGSCRRETIKGGTVTVGQTQSTVTDGQVETQTMKCDRAALRLASAQASQSGAAAIRVAPPAIPGMLPRPEITVHSVSPVLRMKEAAAVRIVRMDKEGPAVDVPASTRVVDLAKNGVKLDKGGLYRFSQGDRNLVVKIDDTARAEAGPLGDRIIPF
jgi:hypothetical protein